MGSGSVCSKVSDSPCNLLEHVAINCAWNSSGEQTLGELCECCVQRGRDEEVVGGLLPPGITCVPFCTWKLPLKFWCLLLP